MIEANLPRGRWTVALPLLLILGVYAAALAASWPRIAAGRTSDLGHFYYAARAMLDGQDPYEAWQKGYVYPPLLAFLYTPLARLEFNTAAVVALALNTAISVATLGLVSWTMAGRLGFGAKGQRVLWVAAVAAVVASDKIRGELQMWQTDLIVLAMFVLALRWVDRRPVWGGAALGLAFNIKYLPIVMLPWLLARRRWRMTAAFAGAAVGFALLPATLVGWNENLRELRVAVKGFLGLLGVPKGGEAAANVYGLTVDFSVSITSAIARWCGPERAHEMGLAISAVLGLAACGAVVLMYRRARMPVLAWPRPAGQEDQPWRAMVAVEWGTIVGLMLAFSPQTNPRHLYLVLLPCALAAAVAIRPGASRSTRVVVGAGLVLLLGGLVLPPGGDRFRAALWKWREVGGTGWCVLAMTLATAWGGLREARACAQEEVPCRS